jgi:rubredoxin
MSDLFPWYAPYTGWVVALLLMCLGTWLFVLGLRRREVPDRRVCPKCRYDLRATPGTQCSECGYVLKNETEARQLGRRTWLALLGLLVAISLPTWTVQHRVRAYGWDYYTRLYPFYWISPDLTLWAGNCNGYDISITEDRRRWCNGTRYENQRVVITRRGELKWSFEAEHIDPGYQSYPGSRQVNLGPFVDLDGDGTSEFVCDSNEGGNSGWHLVHIFRLGEKLESLNPNNERRDSYGGIEAFTGPDARGRFQAEGVDHAFVFFHTCHAGSCYPAVKFRITRAGLQPAGDLMRTIETPMAEREIEEIVRTCHMEQYNNERYAPLNEGMTRLLYAGHWGAALKLLDRAWWGSTEQKARYLDEFDDCVKQSPYRMTLYELGYRPPRVRSEPLAYPDPDE